MNTNEDIIVIDSWIDDESKKNDLLRLINELKCLNIQILLVSHHPIPFDVQELIDYYIYEKSNPILTASEYDRYEINSDRWSEFDFNRIINKVPFHHDYAIWKSMRNAFNFCSTIGKKYIHFLEFDNLPNINQYRQSFVEEIRNHDAIIYEYDEGSSSPLNNVRYCATFLFSLKTNIAIRMFNKINSKEEYFKGRLNWQLERTFMEYLVKITDNIGVSKYISNNNELNLRSAWNRNGISRNGASFQIYLAVNENDLYLHLISGFDNKKAEKDYLIELNYCNTSEFILLSKDQFFLKKIGTYSQNDNVKLYYEGVEVFNEELKDNVENFKFMNNLIKEKIVPKKINIHFIDGPFVEILDDSPNKYLIEFINGDNGEILFSSNINNNCWSRCSIQYFVNWEIKISSPGYEETFKLDLTNKTVLISMESKSLGDTIAWFPYVEEFRKKHKCIIICSTFHNDLFRGQYKNIIFVDPGSTIQNLTALYRIGLFYTDNNIDYFKHPSDPLKIPLSQISNDILGLEYKELRPKLKNLGTKKIKRVCIGFHSTAQLKYWNNKEGWSSVVNYLISKGYEVLLLSNEENGYMGNTEPSNVKKMSSGSLDRVLKTLQESELFIGISSGLSFLSWASGTKTMIISGFTDDYLEPRDNIIRIINKDVCHGCWHTHKFDPSDWNYCPIHRYTDREFECSKSISAESVISQLSTLLD